MFESTCLQAWYRQLGCVSQLGCSHLSHWFFVWVVAVLFVRQYFLSTSWWAWAFFPVAHHSSRYALEFSYFFPPSRLEFRFGRWQWARGGPGRLRGFFLYSVRRSDLRADRPTVRGRPLHASEASSGLHRCVTWAALKESWRHDVGVRRSLVKNDKRHQPTFQESSSNTPMIGLIQGKVNWSNCLVSDLNM